MSELLPCPFCGGEAKLREYPFSDHVSCENESCLVRPSVGVEHDNAVHSGAAIEAWNTRHERTCHIIEKDQEPGMYCSECGALIEDRYCSHCGLKVVEHD